MTAINLALRNTYGYVIWGNSLANEKRLIYRTGFNLRGVVREIPAQECSGPVQQVLDETQSLLPQRPDPAQPDQTTGPSFEESPQLRGRQLRLF